MRGRKRKGALSMQDGGGLAWEDLDDDDKAALGVDNEQDYYDMSGQNGYTDVGTADSGSSPVPSQPSTPAAESPSGGGALNSFPSEIFAQRQSAALEALRQARIRATEALRPQGDDKAMWLSIASGLLSPTQTGGFGESVGKAAGNAAPFVSRRQDQDAAYRGELGKMDYDLASSEYQQAIKPPTIIDYYDDEGLTHKAVIGPDGVPIPFGAGKKLPMGGGGLQGKLDTLSKTLHLTPQQILMDPKLRPLLGGGINVQVDTGLRAGNKAADAAGTALGNRAVGMLDANDLIQQTHDYLVPMREAMENTPSMYRGPFGELTLKAAQTLQAAGFDIGEGANWADLATAIQSKLAPAMRQSGSGSSSDRDVKLFFNSLPNLAQSKEGSKLILDMYDKVSEWSQKRAEVIQNAFERGDYTASGAQTRRELKALGRPFSESDVKSILTTRNKKDESWLSKEEPAATAPVAPVNMQDNGESITITPGGG